MFRLAAIFFATGFVSATWAARIPAVKEHLALGDGALGLAVLAIEFGALAGLPLGAALATRLGGRRPLPAAFAVFAAALLAAVVAPTLAALAACLAAWACANSVIDVAMNVQGVELERREGRPLLSRLHSAHSFGLVGGGAIAVAAAGAGVALPLHVAAVGALTIAGTLAAARSLPEGSSGVGRVLARPAPALLKVGALAFAAAMADGAASNWSAVHLRSVQHASPGLAAAGFTTFALSLAVGRLAGDGLVARAGRARVVRAGSGVAAIGTLAAIAAPGAAAALLGWALVGLGLAAVMPAALGAAPGLSDAPPGVAIASVSTIGYLGSFTGPPLIGFVAGFAGLSLGMGVLVVACGLAAALAPRALRDAVPSP
jgi:MFS family permease